MDEPNIYGSTSNNNRRFTEESIRRMDEPMEQDDQEQKVPIDHRQRRAERRECRCESRRRRSRRRRRQILSQNPFIIYYLELYFKNPEKHVTEVARQAGKEWSAMSDDDRQKYIRLAERERRRRRRRMTRRRRRC